MSETNVRASLAEADQSSRPGTPGNQRPSADLPAIEQVFAEALALHQAGKLEDAEALYRRLLGSRGKAINAAVHNNLGSVLKGQGRLGEAIENYRDAIALDPRCSSAHTNLGNALMDAGDAGAAVSCYQTAIAIDPGNAGAHSNLGAVLTRQDRWDEAAISLREAIRLDPQQADSWYLLGRVFQERGDGTQAAECYHRALKLDPGDPCGASLALAFLDKAPVPLRHPDDYLHRYYADKARDWDQGVGRSTAYRGVDLVRDAVLSLPQASTGLDVLDAGCGTGLCGVFLRPLARRLDGVDLSPHMIDKARAKQLYDRLILDDLGSYMRGRRATYNLVVSAGVLIHLGDLSGVFAAAAHTLRPEGLFAFTVFHHGSQSFAVMRNSFFAHSRSYVVHQADRAGFSPLVLKEAVQEYHDDKPIPGLVVVLNRRS